jgi:uncharacterized protein (TIGR00299 family) protein
MQAARVIVDIHDDRTSRTYADIRRLIADCSLADEVKSRSLDIFARLANAESSIHGCRPEEVHFHEVGGLDAIVDVVGASLCMKYLAITEIYASRIPLGTGFVDCRHGRIPLPAPATLELLKTIPTYGTGIENELVTPTGAAIVATLATAFGPMPEMTIHRVGYGAGERELAAVPNLLRIVIGSSSPTGKSRSGVDHDRILMVETSIDDMNPEIFGYLMDRLFEDGALDVYYIPIFMKKNRPATLIQVLAPLDRREVISQRLFAETTTTGIRCHEIQRQLLPREVVEVETSFGRLPVKRVCGVGGNFRLVPEFDVCKKIAVANRLPLQAVYEKIAAEVSHTAPAKK